MCVLELYFGICYSLAQEFYILYGMAFNEQSDFEIIEISQLSHLYVSNVKDVWVFCVCTSAAVECSHVSQGIYVSLL